MSNSINKRLEHLLALRAEEHRSGRATSPQFALRRRIRARASEPAGRTAIAWSAPIIYEVLALPAPRGTPDGWNDIQSVPTEVWVKAREEESPYIRTVCYSASAKQELHPWVTRDRKHRLRWDVFDAWRSEAA